MRVLGVDPGLTRCGLGVVETMPGRRVRMIAVDVVRTPPDAELASRLLEVSDAVEAWIVQTRPDVVAVERVFSQHNVSTVMGTAQAAGVALLAAARAGLPVVMHTPSEVKAAVTGSGTAGKDQVAAMVTRILGLPERPRPADAADALALAICHAWRDGTAVTLPGEGGGAATPAQRAWRLALEKAHKPASRAARPAPGRRTAG